MIITPPRSYNALHPMAQSMNEHIINWQTVGEETIVRVRDLLRLATRNPPGNEIRVVEYLRILIVFV